MERDLLIFPKVSKSICCGMSVEVEYEDVRQHCDEPCAASWHGPSSTS